MKHTLLTLILAMAALPSNVSASTVPIYLGTYTRGEDGAKGIYLTLFNTQDGSMTEPKLVAEVSNPAFLAKHPTLPRLYAISEGGPGGSSLIHAYSIDPATYALTKLNEQPVPARGACHLGVFPLPPSAQNAPKKYAVMVAFYGEGAVASLPLQENGQLAPYATIHKHVGSGPNQQRQTQAHAHAMFPIFKPWVVAAPDLGADKLFFYGTHADGRIVPYGEFRLPPGSGPRHMAFTAWAQTAFILNELNSTITVAACTGSNVSPTVMKIEQTISTLSEGKVVEGNTTAAIFLHPNERFLYASNRGDDSIALFHFDPAKRQLTFIETVPCGRHPRSFDLSPDGKWLIAAAMHDEKITTFRIDSETGRLTPTGHSISVKQPACVLPMAITAEDRTAVRALRLDKTGTTDVDLETIAAEYPNLVELTLGETKVTDAGLIHLLPLKKLRKIRLSKTAITDSGMNALAKCEFLEDVDISQTKVGDFGIWELRALPRLKNLNLYLTRVTDTGLDSFRVGEHRSAAKIERLNLDKCPITDAGIPKLASLTSLAWTHLGGTAITDTGLAELAKLSSLKEAIVTKTETTLQGVEQLRKDRPDLNVRDNVSEKVPQAEIDEAVEYRKQLASIREG